jgi:hypothetical protein
MEQKQGTRSQLWVTFRDGGRLIFRTNSFHTTGNMEGWKLQASLRSDDDALPVKAASPNAQVSKNRRELFDRARMAVLQRQSQTNTPLEDGNS